MFHTRASKGCLNCRKRRIKCNQLEPACSQCVRAGKECGGYRDELSLMFQNETSTTFEKGRPRKGGRSDGASAERSAGAPFVEPSATSNESGESTSSQWMSESPDSSLSSSSSSSLTLEEQGAAFFFRRYALRDSLPMGADSEVTSSKLWKTLSVSPALLDTIVSIGWAGLSNVSGNKELMVTARVKYTSALKNTMAALGDPEDAALEETLNAIMLHAIFIMVTTDTEAVPESGGNHIHGAAALAISRGLHRFNDRASFRSVLQVCYSTMVICIERTKPFPEEIGSWLRKGVLSGTDIEWPATTLAAFIIDFVTLNMQAKNGQIQDREGVIDRCQAIDQELEGWFSQLPPKWTYTTIDFVPENDDEISFHGQCHSYLDPFVAKILNYYRWARIMISDLLIDHATRLLPSPVVEGQKQRALAIARHMATGICIGAPLHLYQHSPPHRDEEYISPVIHGAFTLIFPLKVAASSHGTTKELKVWIISLLEHVGRSMGILQVLAIVRELKEQ